jgi:hypothetical protein
VDEKLQSYKIKKLKSKFKYLQSELDEYQYIYTLALAQFYKDFTVHLTDEKMKNSKPISNKILKEKELTKLYYRIAEKTHPDKLINKDIPNKEKEKLESLYKDAGKASSENNYDVLVDIADKLGFDDIINSEFFLEKSIDKVNTKIKHLKTTYAWAWYHVENNMKPIMKEQIIKSYKEK